MLTTMLDRSKLNSLQLFSVFEVQRVVWWAGSQSYSSLIAVFSKVLKPAAIYNKILFKPLVILNFSFRPFVDQIKTVWTAAHQCTRRLDSSPNPKLPQPLTFSPPIKLNLLHRLLFILLLALISFLLLFGGANNIPHAPNNRVKPGGN